MGMRTFCLVILVSTFLVGCGSEVPTESTLFRLPSQEEIVEGDLPSAADTVLVEGVVLERLARNRTYLTDADLDSGSRIVTFSVEFSYICPVWRVYTYRTLDGFHIAVPAYEPAGDAVCLPAGQSHIETVQVPSDFRGHVFLEDTHLGTV